MEYIYTKPLSRIQRSQQLSPSKIRILASDYGITNLLQTKTDQLLKNLFVNEVVTIQKRLVTFSDDICKMKVGGNNELQ